MDRLDKTYRKHKHNYTFIESKRCGASNLVEDIFKCSICGHIIKKIRM